MARSAKGEIFGFVKLCYEHLYGQSLEIKYETYSSFQVIKDHLPLVEGWNGVIKAPPFEILKKNYDKVIYIARDLTELCKACAKYFRGVKTDEDYIHLALKEPDFFINIERDWKLMEKEVSDPRFLKITLNDWNRFTRETYHRLLDFLEFPREGRIEIAPVKFTEEERDFEGYSSSFVSKGQIVNERIEAIRNA